LAHTLILLFPPNPINSSKLIVAGMSEKYNMRNKDSSYFLTLTVVEWINVFANKRYNFTILDSLRYCQQNKMMEIYGYCLMSNHLHMIAAARGRQNLSEILRDLKNFTAKKIIRQIQEGPESRRTWLVDRFVFAGKPLKRIEKYKFWKDGNHPIALYNSRIFYQTLNYIHMNPVKAMIVEKPEDYLFSSARNYAGYEGLLPVMMEVPRLQARV
jgi:putative transposase